MTNRKLVLLFFLPLLLVFGVVSTGCGGGSVSTRPLSAEEALDTFEIVEGFRVELFAAEPDVIDPVEMAFDEQGGVYVAELADNPEDPPEGEPPLSRVVYLEDTDDDGVIDRRTVFADRVLSVEGVLPWRGGVIATAAPDILFLKDTDGDGKADVRKVLYTGFAMGNPEGRLSNPRLGIDNWVYVVNHAYPGEITSPDHPERPPIQVRGWDFRFHPDRGLAEVASGNAQFGLSFDPWGNAFIASNTIHLRHTVIPARYLARNPFLVVSETAAEISADGRPAPIFPRSQPQQWRVERTAARQKRYKETRPGRIERLEGYFTAAAGATVYVGDAFPEELVGSVFVGDGNGNLVHRDTIEPDGATFSAHSQPGDREFLTSTDNWFRPVNFANAPDGNLYVLDYYREYLEHPDFIPDAIKKRLRMDFRHGDTLGRIYRIVPDEPRRHGDLKPNLGSASTAELVEQLRNPNGWHRRTAQRLLVERQDQKAIPLLGELAKDDGDPLARLHALWTLEGLTALDASLVEAALSDEHPAVREHALRLAEAYLPRLARRVLPLADDASPKVQFQAALTLGELVPDARALQALAEIAARHADERWFRLAVASTAPDAVLPLLTKLMGRPDFVASAAEGKQKLVSELSRTLGARRQRREITRWLRTLAALPAEPEKAGSWRRSGLEGLAAGLALEGNTGWQLAAVESALMKFVRDPSIELQQAARQVAQYFELTSLIQEAMREAQDESLPLDRRAMALGSLRGGKFAVVSPVLEEILTSPSPQQLQLAAAESLNAFDEARVGDILLRGWRGYGPETRHQVAESLLRHRERVGVLLDALEEGTVEARALDAVTRIRLTQFPDEEIQRRAQTLLQAQTRDRTTVVAQYQDVLDLAGEPPEGEAVFERECAKCHLRQAERGRIGPDLSGVNNHSRETLLNNILDPSAAIEARYTNYLVETKEGRLYDGVLVAETSAAVTLRGEMEDVTLLRKSIAQIRASSVSLMPEGLEEGLSRQELADVIAYLRAGL